MGHKGKYEGISRAVDKNEVLEGDLEVLEGMSGG